MPATGEEGAPSAPERAPPSPGAERSGRETGKRKIVVGRRTPVGSEPTRANSMVTQEEMRQRIPRSTPEALRYEPGVYMQQTAHSQASPYIRGQTGQQTVMLYDGIRLNNATFRQGPNQYFFTIDSRTTDSLEVIRGSASTRFGSDALGGAILANPITPTFGESRKWSVRPTGVLRTHTADGELGGRAQLDVVWNDRVGVVGGVGYRDLGRLKSGGRLQDPGGDDPQTIPPLFAGDGKTQRGTGFEEFTADTRLEFRVSDHHRLTAAYYDYRQLNAPRTDKCPEVGENLEGCFIYQEQFRTLGYLAWEVLDGPPVVDAMRWTLSYQNQHERRRDTKGGSSQDVTFGRDDVHSLGTGLVIRMAGVEPASWFSANLRYGGDSYVDLVNSVAWVEFQDVGVLEYGSRGQYVDGSRYSTSGLWSQLETTWFERFGVNAGGRLALVTARSPQVAGSETRSVDRVWFSPVGNAGVSLLAAEGFTVLTNVNQGLRAPNLDDLTSRQKTGQGFQLESPTLGPERSTSVESGVKVRHPRIELDAFVFGSRLANQIVRDIIPGTECPPSDSECASFATVIQLVNAKSPGYLWGVDGGIKLFLPLDIRLRASLSYVWGEQEDVTAASDEARAPMSRIPPLNGTAELIWDPTGWGIYLATALRWAVQQDRLSPGDENDPRIPFDGGTPGHAVVDLRAGYTVRDTIRVGLVFENVANAPYRAHGSAINGPGRSLMTQVVLGF